MSYKIPVIGGCHSNYVFKTCIIFPPLIISVIEMIFLSNFPAELVILLRFPKAVECLHQTMTL